MNRTIRYMAILAVSAFALGLPGLGYAADANPPERMTYQGYLVDGDGNPLGADTPANYSVTFRIYSSKQGGTAVWAEQQTVTVDKGYFSVLLGEGATTASGEPRSDLSAVFDDADASDRYIGITVSGLGGADVEIAPRLQLVTSPFAFTATQARQLTDGSGNQNFFKEGSSLKLGAGETPTLTLDEAGKLTLGLSGYGVGLQIDNGGGTTTLGAGSEHHFHVNTDSPTFLFNKSLVVDGDIQSQARDMVLYPSNNSDTRLTIDSDSDEITAKADRFTVQGDSNYLQTKFTSNKVELHTDAASFYMNRYLTLGSNLEVEGNYINHYGISPTMAYYDSDNEDYWIHVNGDRMYFLHGTEDGWNPARPLVIHKSKIGMGTASPGDTLHVVGSGLTLEGTQEPALRLKNPGFTQWEIFSGGGGSTLYNNKLVFYQRVGASPGHKMVITDAGHVGIGAPTPYASLHVFEPAHAGNGYEADVRVETTNQRLILKSHFHGGVIQYSSIQSIANSAQAWTLALNPDGGNVGIGTTSPSRELHVEGRIFASGTITPSSDRRAKTDLEPVDPMEVLERVVDLPIERWRFKTEDEGVKHVGPMAQDFHEAFGLGESDTAIATVDADGVAFAAIQGLNLRLNEKEAEIDSLETRNRGLEAEMETLQDEVALLKASLSRLEELVGKMGQGL